MEWHWSLIVGHCILWPVIAVNVMQAHREWRRAKARLQEHEQWVAEHQEAMAAALTLVEALRFFEERDGATSPPPLQELMRKVEKPYERYRIRGPLN